jgi:NAD(P)H dehydrogenase (quinone)
MKINVMTATGQLGRKVMDALLAQGAHPEDLIASARTPDKAADIAARGVTVRRADYEDTTSMEQAFQGSEVLLLIPSKATVEPRILQHARALDAAHAAGVKRVVFSSLSTAVPNSKFLVSPFMLYAESRLRLSGMDWTILRNGMYLDPVAAWVPELVAMGRLPYPVKSGRVAYISRDDLARATAAALLDSKHGGQIYELTGPYALSMPELAQAITQVTGQPVRFDSITEAKYAEICRTGEEAVSELMIEFLVSLYRAVDNGEFATITDHVERLTGTPAMPVKAYLRQAAQKL